MKIPETTANVGAYYGNEENGQWQPNGVILDSGVGGGVVGSGDAGIHRPPVYPVHIPRGHMPGYVMAGAYFPAPYPPVPAPAPDDFADYMWMENEEEFDKQVMQQLEEEALMEQCIEAMLEDEQREKNTSTRHRHQPTTSNGSTSLSLEETVSRSTLNPLAAEFVPTGVRLPPVVADVPEDKSASQPQDTNKTEELTEPSVEDRPSIDSTEDPQPPKDPPEVSAADVQPIDSKRPKEPRDPKESRDPKAKPKEVKKPAKAEAKKTRPVVVKSETKVPQKKKDVKAVKSEVKLDEEDITKPQPSPTEEATPVAPGIKPINYAAAAKANKPKKASTPPVSDKSTPPPQPKPEKTEKKPPVKAEKPTVQRKNSAK